MSSDPCPGSDHRAPRTGGSCGCGMVTVVPARPAAPRTGIRELLARCLDEDADPDRLLAALAVAGLVLTPRGDPAVPA